MKPTDFPGSNITIAKEQPPYYPLPARVFGDEHGTLLTCWELDENELQELLRTRRLYVTILTFNHPLQPIAISADCPVREVNPNVRYYGEADVTLELTLTGYTIPGWYFWDETRTACYGPYQSQDLAERSLNAYMDAIQNHNKQNNDT
jgi:hypothetical protein